MLEAEHELAAALGVAAVHFGEGVEDVLDGGLVGIAAEGIDGVPCGFAGFGFVAGLPPAPGDPMDGLGGAAAFRGGFEETGEMRAQAGVVAGQAQGFAGFENPLFVETPGVGRDFGIAGQAVVDTADAAEGVAGE